MQKATSILKECRFNKITLWVFDKNVRAKAFYQKFCFKPSGNAMLQEIAGIAVTEVEYALQK